MAGIGREEREEGPAYEEADKKEERNEAEEGEESRRLSW
jgi:hypothetical protein